MHKGRRYQCLQCPSRYRQSQTALVHCRKHGPDVKYAVIYETADTSIETSAAAAPITTSVAATTVSFSGQLPTQKDFMVPPTAPTLRLVKQSDFEPVAAVSGRTVSNDPAGHTIAVRATAERAGPSYRPVDDLSRHFQGLSTSSSTSSSTDVFVATGVAVLPLTSESLCTIFFASSIDC